MLDDFQKSLKGYVRSEFLREYAKVKEAMFHDFTVLREDTPLRTVIDIELDTGEKGFPVVSSEGKLKGVLTASDVRKAFEEGKADLNVKDVMTKKVVTVYPDDPLQIAVEKMECGI